MVVKLPALAAFVYGVSLTVLRLLIKDLIHHIFYCSLFSTQHCRMKSNRRGFALLNGVPEAGNGSVGLDYLYPVKPRGRHRLLLSL